MSCRITKRSFLFCLLFVLEGCAFEPLYKSESFSDFHIKRPDVQIVNTDLVYRELKRFFNNDDVNTRFVVTFIIDETGTIQKIIRNVNVHTHGEDILEMLDKSDK